MTIAVRFDLPDDTLAQYDEAFRLGGDALFSQPDRRFHVCYETATGFSVLDVWESEEAFTAFGEVLGPYLAKTGLAPIPQVHQVHQTITASGDRGH
jgi:hypothetical protein